MKIVFFGNPEFSIPSLISIVNSQHTLLSVITSSNKKSGRGLMKTASAIRSFCDKESIKSISFDDFQEEAYNYLKKINADLFVVVAFQILPESIINIPKYGSINIHPSLLPKYRGTSPIQYALLNGDSETGVTIFKLNKKVDSGNIIVQNKYKIDDNIIFSDLYRKLSEFGSELLMEAINLIENGNVAYSPQNKNSISYTKKIHTNDCIINWDMSAKSIHNKIRAFSRKPGAFTFLNNKKIKILNSKIDFEYNQKLQQSRCVYVDNKLLVGTRDKPIIINNLQVEGKNIITGKDFSNSIFFHNNQTVDFE